MTILDSLRQVEDEMFDNHHPIAKEAESIREAYAIGYAMLVCLEGFPNEIVKIQLKREIAALNLPEEFIKTVTDTVMNANPNVVYHILSILVKPEHKYIFMLDLYKYAFQDKRITEQEQEFLLLFERLLELSADELHFVRGFRLAMMKRNVELASKVVQEAISCNLPVRLQELQYFFKGLELPKHKAQNETDKIPTYQSKAGL